MAEESRSRNFYEMAALNRGPRRDYQQMSSGLVTNRQLQLHGDTLAMSMIHAATGNMPASFKANRNSRAARLSYSSHRMGEFMTATQFKPARGKEMMN